MLNLDFQRAEVALKAGRLEDVVAIVQRAQIRKHRSGQELVDRLVAALVRRGEEHFAAHRLTSAKADAESAANLAGRQSEVVELVDKIELQMKNQSQIETSLLLREAAEAYHDGRLDRLVGLEAALLARKNLSKKGDGDVREMLIQIRRCRDINTKMAAGDFHEVQRQLKLLARCYDDDGWTTESLRTVAEIIPRLDSLHAGPLGLINGNTSASIFRPPTATNVSAKKSDPFQLERPSAQLLQVDGVGSLLLLSNPRITIGGMGRTQPCDLTLQTDAVDSPLIIRRDGDDYMATSDSPFRVNDTATRRALLSHDDLVQIGRRGRMRFRKPVAASASAILQLSSAGIARRDVKQIVLIADGVLLGPAGCHVKVDGLAEPVMLSLVEGRLMLRKLASKLAATALALNDTVAIDGVRFGLREMQ